MCFRCKHEARRARSMHMYWVLQAQGRWDSRKKTFAAQGSTRWKGTRVWTMNPWSGGESQVSLNRPKEALKEAFVEEWRIRTPLEILLSGSEVGVGWRRNVEWLTRGPN